MVQKTFSLSEIEAILHHLNYRWSLNTLALWKGQKAPIETYRIYEDYAGFLKPDTLARIDTLQNPVARHRLRHCFMDHCLQQTLLPHEAEMRTWMKGASANVDGRKIYFRDIISWCQQSSTYESRKILQNETRALCKFLKPFALNHWIVLLEMLEENFGFQNYTDYCRIKKNIDYSLFYDLIKWILLNTESLYFDAMEKWCYSRFKHPMAELSRFDAINLLSLKQFDPLCRNVTIENLSDFFLSWDMDIQNHHWLNLELGEESEKSAQAMCFIFQVPEEVYILMRPQGGWADLETFLHELGHGLSAVFTSSDLPLVDREMATSFALSESFAFLLQDLVMSEPFVEHLLGPATEGAMILPYYKALRDLSLFRRYGAKFISEYEMFRNGDLSDGNAYAARMLQYTGFYYQPESHLFDLVPEFYCADYLMGWMAAAMMGSFLHSRLGDLWMFHAEAGHILRSWWKQGNQLDLSGFLIQNELGPLRPDLMVNRWKCVLENPPATTGRVHP